MNGCQTCGGFGNRHDPIAHDQQEDNGEPCITDWLCLPGAHLEFGECVDGICPAELHTTWGEFPIDLRCERKAAHMGQHSANGSEWEWGDDD